MDSVRWFVLLCWLLATVVRADISNTLLDECDIKLEPIGCYSDTHNDRAMDNQILNARDPQSPVYANYTQPWGKQYATFLPKFLCQCAKMAIKRGYRIIGVQFFGECWSSFNSHRLFLKHGKTDRCMSPSFQPCKDSDPVCTGQSATNFAYRIAPTVCDTYYKPIGCYQDLGNVPRPVPLYTMNERDYKTDNWNGLLIDWKNWNIYSSYMVCRCAEMAMEMGHDLFALQFYGECWTGQSSEAEYDRDGPSERCLAKNFDRCPYNSYHCVGMDHANRVYQLTDRPEKMSSAIAESDAHGYVRR